MKYDIIHLLQDRQYKNERYSWCGRPLYINEPFEELLKKMSTFFEEKIAEKQIEIFSVLETQLVEPILAQESSKLISKKYHYSVIQSVRDQLDDSCCPNTIKEVISLLDGLEGMVDGLDIDEMIKNEGGIDTSKYFFKNENCTLDYQDASEICNFVIQKHYYSLYSKMVLLIEAFKQEYKDFIDSLKKRLEDERKL